MQWYAVVILRSLKITTSKIIKSVLQWHDVFVICSRRRGIVRFGTSISEDPRTSLRESLCFEEAEDSWGVARLGFVVTWTCASSYPLCEPSSHSSHFQPWWGLQSSEQGTSSRSPFWVRAGSANCKSLHRQHHVLCWGTKAWPEVPVDKSMWGLVSLTWPCEDGEDERCNRFNGQSWNSYSYGVSIIKSHFGIHDIDRYRWRQSMSWSIYESMIFVRSGWWSKEHIESWRCRGKWSKCVDVRWREHRLFFGWKLDGSDSTSYMWFNKIWKYKS